MRKMYNANPSSGVFRKLIENIQLQQLSNIFWDFCSTDYTDTDFTETTEVFPIVLVAFICMTVYMSVNVCECGISLVVAIP